MNPLTTAIIAALTKAVFPIISAFVAGFAVVLLRKLALKFHIDASVVNQKLITSLAEQGVGMAEERALNAIKNKGIKITSNGKLDLAVAHILGAVPAIGRQTAERYAEAAVAKIAGVGSTGTASLK